MNNSFALELQSVIKSSYETLSGTMQGVTTEVAHFVPPGKALPIGSAFLHAVISEDILVNEWARKEKTLLQQGWDKKAGISEMHPKMDADWEKNFTIWSKTVQVDLSKSIDYATVVHNETINFIQSLSDTDLLEKKVDLSIWNLGEWSLFRFLAEMVAGHNNSISGEISAIKGVQGLKGYPF